MGESSKAASFMCVKLIVARLLAHERRAMV